ncbi:hypothetical protein JCM11641_004158 [Rhodosporidiobolus odoratus]
MSAPARLSFGLNKAALPRQPQKKPPAKSLFGAGDDDDDSSSPAPPNSALANSRPRVSTASLTKAQKAKQKAELELDSSTYQYDEVYDNMKAAEKVAVEERKKESSDRKPRYINRLLETAELRKQDRLRAEDKMIQREREREGDEFVDKDAFVTPAYLKQKEELRKAEEEEKKREEAEGSKKNGGMASFLKNMLDTSAATHDAAVAAAQSAKPVFGPTFNVEPPPKEKTDAQLAAEAEEKLGRKIELNQDGEIIDRRQLMTGGLNIVAKSRAAGTSQNGGFSLPIAARPPSGKEEQDKSASLLHPGVSPAERARQARERQSREIERQMVALETKRKREAEEQLDQKVQKVARRNDDDKVAALQKAAEERRKKREEEKKAAAAAAGADGA